MSTAHATAVESSPLPKTLRRAVRIAAGIDGFSHEVLTAYAHRLYSDLIVFAASGSTAPTPWIQRSTPTANVGRTCRTGPDTSGPRVLAGGSDEVLA